MTNQKFDPNKTTAQKIVHAVKGDVVPQSSEHTARLVFGGLLLAAAVYQFVRHTGDWSRGDLEAMLGFAGLGCGIVFTGSVVALIKALAFWKKGGE